MSVVWAFSTTQYVWANINSPVKHHVKTRNNVLLLLGKITNNKNMPSYIEKYGYSWSCQYYLHIHCESKNCRLYFCDNCISSTPILIAFTVVIRKDLCRILSKNCPSHLNMIKLSFTNNTRISLIRTKLSLITNNLVTQINKTRKTLLKLFMSQPICRSFITTIAVLFTGTWYFSITWYFSKSLLKFIILSELLINK